MNEIEKLKQSVAQKLNERINPPKDQLSEPMNRLWIALIAFNLIFLPLDIATGSTVGYVTRWYYGIFVFASGFGTMIFHEALFSNPYAGKWQKVISVVGFLTSVCVTAIIGLAAIIVNVLMTGYNKELYGVGMAGTAFLVLFFHGVLFAVYYFIDHGIRVKQNAASKVANHKQTIQDFNFSEQLVDRMNALEGRIMERIQKGDGERLGAALNNLTGQEWIDTHEQRVARYNSDTGKVPTLPNSEAGKP